LSGLLGALAGHQLLVVTGKGGVGKTTVAVTLAAALAAAGKRVLLLEIDPRENAHRMLGVDPSGGAITAARPRLWLQNLRPRAVLDDLVREQVRIGPVVRRILGSEIYRHFAEGAPGFKELAILGHAIRMLRGIESVEPRGGRRRRGGEQGDATASVDLVVIDAPASGHGISLLLAPRLTATSITSGPFARLAGELAQLVDDPARTGVVAVTAGDEMPMQEAIELLARLRAELGRDAAAVIVNGLFPALPERERERLAASEDPPARLWARRRAVNDRELLRLRAEWTGPTRELPLLPLESGPALVAALSPLLDGPATEGVA